MPSLQSRLARFVLQHRHWLRFKLTRPAFDGSTSIPNFRETAEKTARKMARMPAGIEVSPITIDGLKAEWILPARATKDKVMLYVHGGGYVSGSCNSHRSIVAKVVKAAKVGAWLFDYRLAPEHPFPAALVDSVAVYRWLLAQGIAPSNIMIVGESAGGGLCLATLIALRDQGIPLPAAAVAISPWTDLKCTGDSYRTKAKVCLAPEGSWTVFSKHYAGDNDPCLPGISPLYGDLHGLPPMLIQVGEDEVLLNDSTPFAEKAKKAGVDITLKVGEEMLHCFPLLSPLFPEAREAMQEICDFIKRHIGDQNN